MNQEEEMLKMNSKIKKQRIVFGVGIVILILLIIMGFFIFLPKQSKAEEVFHQYISFLKEQKYEEMYQLLSKESQEKISQEDFVKRNKNIYEGMEASAIKIEIHETEKAKNQTKITYEESMETIAGEIHFSNTATILKEEKENKLKWNSSMILPQLRDSDKIRVSTLKGKRGEILDRNGKKLAENGKISSVGIVPGKLGENQESSIQKISELLEVSIDYINTQLQASYVKKDTFVPIKKVAMEEIQLKEKLLQIPGIMITSVAGRVYPLGEETAHLIGYVQPITQEELQKREGQGYHASSIIGKTGLELAYEERLKETDGAEIYIEDEQGNQLKTLAKREKKDGENITLTIDSTIQKQLYDQLKQDQGFFVVMEPTTGELLALVSTPTFNSNDFVIGLSNQEWENLNQDKNKPLYNRFLQSYSPGSTFKPITGAIGLTTNKIQAKEDFGYTGTSWKNNDRWGNYQVTTLTAYSGPKNLTNALIHSDNIYFAKTALKIGADPLMESLNKIGFNESIDFPLNLKKSTYSSKEKIDTEIQLADTGYGQGSVLVNPIHMASIYSAFANEGNMIRPYLEYQEGKTEILKQNVFTKEAAEAIKNGLIQVVENVEGTANDMKIAGTTIAGKTGTAELKRSNEDKESGTLGWFDCFTIERNNGKDLLIISMVENAQDNRDGGSHYLIKKIRTLF